MREIRVEQIESDLSLYDNSTSDFISTINGNDTEVMFFDGANNPAGDADFTYDKTNHAVGLGALKIQEEGGNNLFVVDTAAAVDSNVNENIIMNLTNPPTAQSGGFVVNNNIALGYQALENIGNGTGSDIYSNVAIGSQSLQNLTTGEFNTGFGTGAGKSITTGQENMSLGAFSHNQSILTGNYNIAIGSYAQNVPSSSDGNINIGYKANQFGTINDDAYSITLGAHSVSSASNQLTIGADNANSEITDARIGVNETSTEGMLRLQQGTGATLADYGGGSITGTATKLLGVTSGGLVTEEDLMVGLVDGDYGDITVGGTGTTMSIDAGAVDTTELATGAVETAKIADDNVTNAKLANSNPYTLKGNKTAGTLNPTDFKISSLGVGSVGLTDFVLGEESTGAMVKYSTGDLICVTDALQVFKSTTTITTGVGGVELQHSVPPSSASRVISVYYGSVGVPGRVGSTTARLLLNGVAMTGTSLTLSSTTGAVSATGLALAVASTDYIEVEVTSTATTPGDGLRATIVYANAT